MALRVRQTQIGLWRIFGYARFNDLVAKHRDSAR